MKDMYVTAEPKTIIATGIIGAIVGALTWGVNLLVQRFFIEPVFCRSADNFSVCANGGSLAFNIALVLLAVAAVAALVKIGGYRPLLVAIAVVISFWSANSWLGVQTWWEATLWLSLLMAVAYIGFSWVARIASFPISVAAMVIVVILARLVIR